MKQQQLKRLVVGRNQRRAALGLAVAFAVPLTIEPIHPAYAIPAATSVQLHINNVSPKTNDLLTTSVTPSGFTGAVTYSYVWKKGSNVISGETGSTLDLSKAGNGDKGDIITCTVTANGSPSSATASDAVTIVNSAPQVTLDLPTRVGSKLLARLLLTDADGDTVTIQSTDTTNLVGSISAIDSQGYFLYTAPASGGAITDTFTITATDGGASGTGTETFRVAAPAAGTKIYTALGASDVQGYGASNYNFNITGVSDQGYAPLVAASNKLGSDLSPLLLSRRAINGLSLNGATTISAGGETTASLATKDFANAYSIWYGPNDILNELLPILVGTPGALDSPATLSGLVTNYTTQWKTGYSTLKNTLAATPNSPKFAAINIPDLGPTLAFLAQIRLGLTNTQRNNLATALTDAVNQMNAQIVTSIPNTVDLKSNTDLNLPSENSLVLNPITDFYTDGFHPNSSGYAKLATRLFRQFDKQFNHAPSITTTSVPGGQQNQTYGPVQLTATDPDNDTVTWSVGTGLPNGVTLSNAGVLGGTPTESGTFNFTVTATDSRGASASKALTLVVLPVASISNVAQLEGNSISTPTAMNFTVNLSYAAPSQVTIDYNTSNGTAAQPGDYTATSGTLTIPAGQSSGVISVPIIGDTVYEPTEAFTLTLSNASGVVLSGGGSTLAATGTITNDDAVPQISVANVSQTEGNANGNFHFTVNLSSPSSASIGFNYFTTDGTAISPADFTAVTNGSVVIPAGQTSAGIDIPLVGDAVSEPDETFTLTLKDANGGTFTGGGATLAVTGTIINDDADSTQAALDVTSQVTVYKSSVTRNRSTGRYILSLVVKNNGATLTGPLYLVTDGQVAGVSLYNPDGTTSRTTPVGSTYRKLVLPGTAPGSLATGTSIGFTIEFVNPNNASVDFTPRVLQGPGSP